MSELPCFASRGRAFTNDTLPLNQEFFRPLGMEHFYDSFALESQISVEALRLFGLREDELLPDLHITRDGVPEADGLRCLGGLAYAVTRAKPLVGRFLSHSLVALRRDDECSSFW